ncbi:MAG: ABC transporter substrate-binding protein [Pseudomonadota bacterium]|jgi:phospholipid transport system substrate-binding protein|nr:ABC transporter substrate-binding protein [Pseudomonadota bacterium]
MVGLCRSALIMLLVVMVQPAVAKSAWDEASAVIDSATRDMLALMENDALTGEENIEAMMREIETIIAPVVDFPYIARQVMGKYYRRASDEEQKRFADVFKTTLLRTYAKSVSGFELRGYQILPPSSESPEPDKQVVSVRVDASNGQSYTLVYYMRRQQGRWTLVNVMVDGINLRITFRNQFADLYERNGSISATIEAWADQMQNIDLKEQQPGGQDESNSSKT